MRNFLAKFVTHLEPRKFTASSDLIQEQYEEVFEVVLIMTGAVGIGYRLFDEIFFGRRILISKAARVLSHGQIKVINDYACYLDKSSEFLYRAFKNTEALAIRRK